MPTNNVTPPGLLEKSELAKLPRWALVALLARCARRYLAHYQDDKFEPAYQRIAVAQAINLTENRAAVGGRDYPSTEAVRLDDQYFDHHDFQALSSTLAACVNAATNTHDEVGHEARFVFAVTNLAQAAFEGAFNGELNDGTINVGRLADEAAAWSAFGGGAVEKELLRDFETLRKQATANKWNDETAVPPAVFGPLWPEGHPEGWPPTEFSFRPQARIIRMIGDRLISGPEAAVIELIKNSHDADATFARVTFVPPLGKDSGQIVIEDDGHGMTLDDIEKKWLEPATADKRERKLSPKGRHLLGSKGIGRFASVRLGRCLELISTGNLKVGTGRQVDPNDAGRRQTSRIPQLDWNEFEEGRYLEDIRFPIESPAPAPQTGTVLKVSALRDDWSRHAWTACIASSGALFLRSRRRGRHLSKSSSISASALSKRVDSMAPQS